MFEIEQNLFSLASCFKIVGKMDDFHFCLLKLEKHRKRQNLPEISRKPEGNKRVVQELVNSNLEEAKVR